MLFRSRIPISATIALSTYCFHNARHSEPEPINLLFSNSFSKFSTLVTLSLSDCNLLALPDDPCCLLSIEYLNLSKNNFVCLPDYISQLSKHKILFLDHCSKLQSLPHVPLSTRLVSVQGCTALENYSNQVVVWTLGVAGFTIITCLGLAEDQDGTIAEVSLLDIHLLWQRYVKVSLSLSLVTHTHEHLLQLFLIFYRIKFIKWKAFAMFYLKLKFQSGSSIRGLGHFDQSHYLQICSVIKIGMESLCVSFL